MKNLKINFIEEASTIKYEEYFFNGDDFKGFSKEIIKTSKETNQILNWIDKSPHS